MTQRDYLRDRHIILDIDGKSVDAIIVNVLAVNPAGQQLYVSREDTGEMISVTIPEHDERLKP